LHGIENGKTRNDRSTGGVDVKVNWFGAIFFVEVEHHTDDLVGKFVVNFGSKEDDTLSVETVVNVNPDFIFERMIIMMVKRGELSVNTVNYIVKQCAHHMHKI